MNTLEDWIWTHIVGWNSCFASIHSDRQGQTTFCTFYTTSCKLKSAPAQMLTDVLLTLNVIWKHFFRMCFKTHLCLVSARIWYTSGEVIESMHHHLRKMMEKHNLKIASHLGTKTMKSDCWMQFTPCLMSRFMKVSAQDKFQCRRSTLGVDMR